MNPVAARDMSRGVGHGRLRTGEVGIIHYGLGPIGLELARLVGERSGLRSVGAVDIDPALVGRNLAELVGGPVRTEVEVSPDLGAVADAGSASIVLHSTTSSLHTVLPQLLVCINAGLSVISTCEELSYPWGAAPELARSLDGTARRQGVVVLGTGINPGFAMDYLPIVLAGASRRVDSIQVNRVQDARVRRIPLQRKVGAGLTEAEFTERVRAGTVRHVGLLESVHAIASAFGWAVGDVQEEIHAVLADVDTASDLGPIPTGHVRGVTQTAIGTADGREVVRLTLEIAVGSSEPRDEVILTGDPAVHMMIPGGLHGDVATAAVVVNSIDRVLAAEPGLRVMADLPPPRPVAS